MRGSLDINWVTEQIAVGGAVGMHAQMEELSSRGVTHILNMSNCDDTMLAAPHGIEVLWNPVDDDFQPKQSVVFRRGVGFAKMALRDKNAKLLVHCAMGIHRAPMMTLAVLGAMGWNLADAQLHMRRCRPCVDFPHVYVGSVERFLRGEGIWQETGRRGRSTTEKRRTACKRSGA